MAQAFLQQILKKNTTAGEMTDFLFSNGDKVGCGKFPPKFAKEGEYYEYGVTEKGQYKNLTSGTFKSVPAPAGIAAPAAAPAPSNSGGNYGGKTSATQLIISRQAAANTALAFVKLLADTDSLPMPKSTAAAKRADVMEDILKEYMNKFHIFATHEPFDFGAAATASDLGLAELEDQEDWNE